MVIWLRHPQRITNKPKKHINKYQHKSNKKTVARHRTQKPLETNSGPKSVENQALEAAIREDISKNLDAFIRAPESPETRLSSILLEPVRALGASLWEVART
eukprot:1003890-Amphidinium_carterae.1